MQVSSPLQIHQLAPTRHQSERTAPPTHIVLHHALVWDVPTAVKVLKRSRTSTHFLIGPDGEVFQLCDPDAKAWHCWSPGGFWNNAGIGIDLCNRLNPKHEQSALNRGWSRVIRTDGFGEGRPQGYIPDTDAALRSAWELCQMLSERYGFGLRTAPPAVWSPSDAAEKWDIVAHATVSEHKVTGRRNRWDGWATLAGWRRLGLAGPVGLG